jgi:hypothetical protein
MEYNSRMEITFKLLYTLLARLEKISADSVWAHRASGVRGSLIRMMEKMEGGASVPESDLQRMTNLGFYILQKAAEEKFK